MKRVFIAIALVILMLLACSISQFTGQEPSYESVEVAMTYEANLTVTVHTLQTRIAEATAEAQATIDAAAEEETPASSGDFCEVYAEYVNDLTRRIEEYEGVVSSGSDGEGHALAVAADESIEAYMDRLAPIAPDEVRPEVELLANMSLIGLLSSQEVFPEAELALSYVDDYAADNCGASFGE